MAEIRGQIKEYNTKFGDDRSIKRVIEELPFVLTHTVDYIFSARFMLELFKSAVFLKGALIVMGYLMLPQSVNLLSTTRLGVMGYLDDVLLIILVAVTVVGRIGVRFMERQEQRS